MHAEFSASLVLYRGFGGSRTCFLKGYHFFLVHIFSFAAACKLIYKVCISKLDMTKMKEIQPDTNIKLKNKTEAGHGRRTMKRKRRGMIYHFALHASMSPLVACSHDRKCPPLSPPRLPSRPGIRGKRYSFINRELRCYPGEKGEGSTTGSKCGRREGKKIPRVHGK